MNHIEKPARSIPVMAETDVLVVGGGPAGLAAAIAASREGVDTMLVERWGSFGGNITQAYVGSIAWYRYEQTREAGGIGVEFETKARDLGATIADSIGIFPEFLDAYGVVILPTTGRYFHVPYGILVPQRVENLLVAGRCVAGDRISHAATRQMLCCAVTGQGAGVAAAVSLKDDTTCRKVAISRVQNALERQGVRVG